MDDWTDIPPPEMERRRKASVEALSAIDREAFASRYQEACDKLYWTHGMCCAGCDHWISSKGNFGQCSAAGIVSGGDVVRSLGFLFSSYIPAPGFPYSHAEHYCGKFRDDFDWSILDAKYLERIGAARAGKVRSKPAHPHSGHAGTETKEGA